MKLTLVIPAIPYSPGQAKVLEKYGFTFVAAFSPNTLETFELTNRYPPEELQAFKERVRPTECRAEIDINNAWDLVALSKSLGTSLTLDGDNYTLFAFLQSPHVFA